MGFSDNSSTACVAYEFNFMTLTVTYTHSFNSEPDVPQIDTQHQFVPFLATAHFAVMAEIGGKHSLAIVVGWSL
jgi:hypothetical protein